MAVLQIPQSQSKTIVKYVNLYVYTYADAYARVRHLNTKY
jgi:hypothetical protein